MQQADKADIATMVREAIASITGANPAMVVDAQSLRASDGLELDSLDIVEVVVQVEEKLGLFVPDDALDSAMTVGDLIKAFETEVKANANR